MKCFHIVLSVFLLSVPLSLYAQNNTSILQKTDPVPKVDSILEKYIEALGGKEKILSVTSRVRTGVVEISGIPSKGTVKRYQKAPNKLMGIQQIPGYGIVQTIFDGTTAWYQRPEILLRKAEGEWLEDIKRQAEFYWPLQLKMLFPKMVLKESIPIANRRAYVIEAHPLSGSTELLYFDSESGLLIRQDILLAGGMRNVVTLLEDYSEVDGIKYPFTIRQDIMTIRYTEVRHDIQVQDSVFVKHGNE
ncbi:MAG: hypothetical protein WDA22_10715 [Bacteroidota bacterium]